MRIHKGNTNAVRGSEPEDAESFNFAGNSPPEMRKGVGYLPRCWSSVYLVWVGSEMKDRTLDVLGDLWVLQSGVLHPGQLFSFIFYLHIFLLIFWFRLIERGSVVNIDSWDFGALLHTLLCEHSGRYRIQ